MSFLYLDIETIETQDPELRARIAAEIKPPASMSKAETIAKWEAESKASAVEEAIAKTSFDGAAGHVVCIGYAVGDNEAKATFGEHVSDERDILETFFTSIKHVPIIVGHNVAWDIRFLTQRAIVLGVRLPYWWPRDPKPWAREIFCTQTAWAGPQGRISLDRLCRTLGIAGKGDITGADVRGMWYAGQHRAIALYCCKDVEKTREIHRKMMVAFGDIEPKADGADGVDDDAAFLSEVA
jgi:3'-5' exonuclease